MQRMTARNQLKGTVRSVSMGTVNSILTVDVDGEPFRVDITRDAVEELGIEAGTQVIAVFNCTSVMVATSEVPVSARNRIRGTIQSIEKGAVNGLVKIAIPGGQHIVAQVTLGSISRLHLAENKPVVAIVKSTDVTIALDE
jgi:molybdate transport system regulatory protein